MNKLERLMTDREGLNTLSEDGRGGTQPSRCSGNPWRDGFHAVRCFCSGFGMVGFISLVFLSGCLSTHPGSSSMAYVDIETDDVAAIRAETIRVFEGDNYELVSGQDDVMVFKREATQRDRMFYGLYGDKQMIMRIEVMIEPRRKGGSLVRLDAFAVHDRVEDKLPHMARRPFQNLLNGIKASLVTSTRDSDE